MGAHFSASTPLAIKRSKRRRRLNAPAKLLTAAGEMEVRLRDLSRAGALAEAARPPAQGSEVVAMFGTSVVPALVAWTIGRRFGLEFDQLIDEEQVAAFHTIRLG